MQRFQRVPLNGKNNLFPDLFIWIIHIMYNVSACDVERHENLGIITDVLSNNKFEDFLPSYFNCIFNTKYKRCFQLNSTNYNFFGGRISLKWIVGIVLNLIVIKRQGYAFLSVWTCYWIFLHTYFIGTI